MGWPGRQLRGGVVAGMESSAGDEEGFGVRKLGGFDLRLDARPEKEA